MGVAGPKTKKPSAIAVLEMGGALAPYWPHAIVLFPHRTIQRASPMKVSIKCKKCGSDQFEIPARPNDSSKVTCGKCGAVETYGKIIKAVGDKVTEDLKRKLGKMFK
ncbi:ECs_2282 family putative zinc-binding protein [Pseudomonas bubulae]|uniref:ECs_2282 family putative zinc-binding protein n=1 Tax=Pseudomonas bubulae TaxID=2316085 RepID=UPI003F989B84